MTQKLRLQMIAAALLTLPTFFPSDSADAQQADAAIRKAARTYATVKTAKGTIQQTITNSLTNKVYNTKADYQQQFPQLVSLRYTDPRGDMIVVDGKAVWIYTPSSQPGVVNKAPMARASMWVNLFKVLLDSTARRFTLTDAGSESIQGVATRAVVLLPRTPMPELLRAKVWIEESTGIIRQFEVNENTDQTHRILFTTLQLGAPVDTTQFRFTVPRNVRVQEIGG